MQKQIKIYNTLTRKKEVLKTVEPGLVKMYSCGPTVYNYAHIGNLRTYIFMDTLRRVLKYNDYEILGVMNITDVGHLTSDGDNGEDKMSISAREQKKTPLEIADFYTNIFFDDFKKLNIETPEKIAKATDHIQDMISFVQDLEKKGYAYTTNDGVYFDTEKFPSYGALSGQKRDDLLSGARISINDEKHNPRDFAVWKKADPNHIMQWESPWGKGYPGWHIECSAMSKKYLGEVFDIHTGGVDHIPVHHENEIAQNEAYAGHKTVNAWMHAEFMLVNNGKMSKSLKNTYTIQQLEDLGFSPMAFRYFCLNTHYRKKLNFTFDSLNSAKISYSRLIKQLNEHKNSTTVTDNAVLNEFIENFNTAVNDDLNMPLALGILWSMLKLPKSHTVYEVALDFDKVLGLSLDCPPQEPNVNVSIPQNVIDLCEKRKKAKENKDYSLADSLRNEIQNLGYQVIDTNKGYEIKPL